MATKTSVKSSSNKKAASSMDQTSHVLRPAGAGSQTMDELLSRTGYSPRGLSRGQTVDGVVVEIGNKSLVVDIGAKSEGLVIEREYEAAKPFIRNLKVGDKIQATVLIPEVEGGNVILSLRESGDEYIWKELMEKFANGETVDARVETATRGGLSVLLYGVSGFVPSSHLGSKVAENPQALTGGNVKLKIIEADREKNRLVLSEKAVSESDQMAAQAAALKQIKKGEEFVGRVSRVVNFGVFVEVEKDGIKMDGLVHLSEISWQKVTSAGEVLKEGESVPVVVIGREEGRLALSIKQRTEDPWTQAIGKYKSDAKVSGKVTKTGEFGAFVELEPGVEGLIHSSKIPADMSVKEGDMVDCFIEEVDGAKHKLSLGLVLKAKPMGYR